MGYLYFILGLAGGAATAWQLVMRREQNRSTGIIQVLEGRLQAAKSESAKLKEHFGQIRTELHTLQERFQREQAERTDTIARVTRKFKRKTVSVALYCGIAAVITGSGLGWLTGSVSASQKSLGELQDVRVRAATQQALAEHYRVLASKLESRIHDLEVMNLEERVEKEVASAKLQILIQSLSPKWGSSAFQLSDQKLKKQLEVSSLERADTPAVPLLPVTQVA